MNPLNFIKRSMRVLALSAVLLNAVAMPVGADEFDTDLDGMPDLWETTYGLTVGVDDSADDLDGDGLINVDEYSYGTDPSNTDTDGDTRTDGDEVFYGTDPAVYEAADLDITDISLDPVTGEISYTAVNAGNLDVDYTIDMGYTAVYVNYGESDQTDNFYDWNTETGSSWVGTFFTAGGSETINTGLTLASGEHSVMVCIDRAAMHGEMASGMDNCEVETFSVGSDLVVTDITFVETETTGVFQVLVDIANTADMDVDSSADGHTESSLNGVAMQNYAWTFLDPVFLDFLSANEGTFDFESFGALVTLEDGDEVQVCVDSTDVVAELNEENNCLTAVYDNGLDPDLIVESVSFDDEDGSVDFVVKNQGTGNVSSDAEPYLNFYFDFFNSDLSTSSTINYAINDFGTEYQTAGGSTAITTGPGSEFPSCTLYVLAVADGTGEVEESDDLNNEYRTSFDLCPVFSVEAGDDMGVGLGYMYNLAAYTLNADTLTEVTVDWGDGSAVEEPTQYPDGDRIDLIAYHLYDHHETFTVTVCANNGEEELCDTTHVSVTGESSGGGDTMPSGSDSSSSGSSGSSGSSDDEDEDVELSGEDDEDNIVADCSAMAFDDVEMGDDFYDAICELWAADIIHGKTENVFDSEDVIRRDEAAKIFTRWYGYVTEAYGETPVVEESSFVDVSAEDALAYYVEMAAEENIIAFDSDTFENEDGELVDEAYFMPHDALTAGEIVEALDQILGEDNEAGEELAEAGYEAADTMTRGSFVDFLFNLAR